MSLGNAMVDIETLGTHPGAVILSIGAVRFDDGGVIEGTDFYRCIDVFSSLMAGLTIDRQTVEWWREQAPEARGPLLNAQHTLSDALSDFGRWLEGEPRVWAKGPDFDLVLLQAAYNALGLQQPWAYRNARDVRTLLSLVPPESIGTTWIKHHALDDAKAQAEAVRGAYSRLGLRLTP